MKSFDRAAYRHQRNKANNFLRKAKCTYNQNLINDNVDKPEKFWKAVNSIYRCKNQTNLTNSSFNIDGKTTCDKSTIADGFNRFFTNIASNLKAKTMLLKDCIWAFPPKVVRKLTSRFCLKPVTRDELKHHLRKLKVKKSTGIDGIPAKLLRECANEINDPLRFIINQCISTAMIPNEWKIAIVIPLFKSGNSSDPDNYRPISVLPVLAKVFEKLVHEQLMTYLEVNNLLSSDQFGFRKNKSPELAVTYFLDNIRLKMDDGLLTGAVFIDLSKAFDTVSHGALLNKLPSFGIDARELQLITHYLFNRKQVVRYDDHIPTPQYRS